MSPASPSSCENAGAAGARRVRVLIVGPSLDILGGQAVQAAALLERLRQEPSLEVDFLPVNPRLPALLGRLQRIRYIRTLLTFPTYCASLLAAVPRYDVVHVFSASYLSFVLAPTPAMLAARLARKKLILNYHSGEAEDHLRRWRRSAIPTVRLADAIVVPSAYLVDVFARFGFSARAIFNVVPADRFRFRERRPLAPVFLANRNLEPMYNVGCVLRAFALIRQQFQDARLLVAGDGSQRPMLERLARELGLSGVKFLGRVPPDDMPALYDSADIFLNASEIDNMPLSLLEAFACGLPVVTTDAGGIPYIAVDFETALLVRRGDHTALASRAIRLLENDALAWRLAHNAYEQSRKYQWDAVGGEWVRLYHELAASG